MGEGEEKRHVRVAEREELASEQSVSRPRKIRGAGRYKFIGNFYLFVCKTGGQTGDYRKEDEDEEDTEELVKESI